MGAGILPFAIHESAPWFLLQTVFEGRKAGLLNDFGGGVRAGEDPAAAAMREFVEETETLYFAEDLDQARRTEEAIRQQLVRLGDCFRATQEHHPDWRCRRASPDPTRPKDWTSYFVELPWRPLEPLNRAWEEDRGRRFKKRRQLFWIDAEHLLWLYAHNPGALWKRVRQLEGAPGVIRAIRAAHV